MERRLGVPMVKIALRSAVVTVRGVAPSALFILLSRARTAALFPPSRPHETILTIIVNARTTASGVVAPEA